ncbi:MAG: MarR family transcriptional regulator [Bacteroidota bacterium]
MSNNPKIVHTIPMTLGFLTNRVGRLMAIHMRAQLGEEKFDMPSHCLGILAELWEEDGIIQQDLAISIVKDKATIARALDLMEKKNIIVRIKDEKDRRNKKIFLTYKGKELQHTVMDQSNQMFDAEKMGISTSEMSACLGTLEKIYHNLKNKL